MAAENSLVPQGGKDKISAPMIKQENRLLYGIILGTVLAALFGSFFPAQAVKCKVLGDLFMNALKMMVLPLLVTAIIAGITSLGDIRRLGSIGRRTLIYYTCTTSFAVLLGILLVIIIKPGSGHIPLSAEVPDLESFKQKASFTELLSSVIHPNLVQAAADFKIVPIIVAAILFAVSLSLMGTKARPAVEFFTVVNEAVMQMARWVIVFTPLGVFGLVSYYLGKAGGGPAFLELVQSLGKFCFTVLLGLVIHGLGFVVLVLWFFAKRNPWEFIVQMSKCLATALATSSSTVTIPVTMKCVQEEAKISRETTNIVIPLGATCNMDGTALYEAVSAIFIAQCYGIELGWQALIIVFITATLASMGAAGIPSAGLVTMVLVLNAVGLPTEGIGLLLTIDWFLDRARTVMNVWSDCVAAAVVDYQENKHG